VIVADVGPAPDQPGRYVLRRIGLGLCAPDRARRDVVVAPGRTGDVGVDLSRMERIVLDAAESELWRGKLAASTPTFALYRAPAVMVAGDAHRDVEVFYAFLVGPGTGALQTFVWAREASATAPRFPKRVIELPSALVYDCALDVQARRLLGAIPVSWSFAMTGLPPGPARTLGGDPTWWTEAMGRNLIDAEALERGLRQALSAGEAVSEPPSNAPSGVRGGAGGPGPGRSERTSTSGSGRPGTRPGAR
jgi:hypothetical protein